MKKKGKTSWVYTPKKINVWRGIGFGMNDLMGGGWNNIVSGVIFVFVMSNGISPALAGAITGIGRIFDAIYSLFFGAITDGFYRNKLGQKFWTAALLYFNWWNFICYCFSTILG